MNGRYQAAFIIPIGASKVLGRDGWEFEGSGRLSKDIEEYLIRALNVSFVKEYSGIKEYVGSHLKMLVVFDVESKIENIFFQVFSDDFGVLSHACLDETVSSKAELFIPGAKSADECKQK